MKKVKDKLSIDELLLDLYKHKLLLEQVSCNLSSELRLSCNGIYPNTWLSQAYEMGHDEEGEYRCKMTEAQKVEFLGKNCKHALAGHLLIQERKKIKKQIGVLRQRIGNYSNKLYKQSLLK